MVAGQVTWQVQGGADPSFLRSFDGNGGKIGPKAPKQRRRGDVLIPCDELLIQILPPSNHDRNVATLSYICSINAPSGALTPHLSPL